MKYININRLFLSVLFISVLLSSFLAYADNTKSDVAESIIRLHVIANSDSDSDQTLKLKVRDRILSEAEHLFNEVDSPEEAIEKVLENSKAITDIARDEILKNNFSYDVRIETGTFPFPQKRYGNLFLPAGNYNAVRIIIGSGEGKNWWCVMFPPLCFTNGTIKLSDDSDSYLKSELTEGEYRLLTDNMAESDIELRFKILEIFSSLTKKDSEQH